MMRILAAAGAMASLAILSQPALAQSDQGQGAQVQQQELDKPAVDTKARIKNPVAEFAGTDKITGRLVSFDVYMNETVQFGALQVTPRVCYSSPEGVEPKTDAFVEIDEITLDRKIRRIFTGWMFAQSPGLNAVEHPVYDVWLSDCKQKTDVPPPQDDSAAKQPKDEKQATDG
jgi:hypothetical protein